MTEKGDCNLKNRKDEAQRQVLTLLPLLRQKYEKPSRGKKGLVC